MTLATNWVDNIGMFVNAAYLNQVGTEVNANTSAQTLAGTFASRPAAATSNSGAVYFCTDTDAIYKSNGSAWTKIRVAGAGGTLADPTALTSFNLGTATLTSDKGDRLLTIPSVAGDNLRGEYQTLSPTSGYTAAAYIDLINAPSTLSTYTGLLLGNSSGSYITFGLSYGAALGSFGISIFKWTSATAASAAYQSLMGTTLLPALPRWFRIRDDGTNRIFEYSRDNIGWNTLFSVGRTDFLTPDRVGWFGYNTSGSTIQVRNRSFVITTP